MPHTYGIENILTNVYIPKVSLEPYLPPDFVQSFKDLESGHIHEGRIVDPSLVAQEHIDKAFRTIGFDCLLSINEQICPRFMLEFLRDIKTKRNQDNSISLGFSVGHYKFSLSLEEFGEILGLPDRGQSAYTEELELDTLLDNREEDGPYRSYIHSLTELIESLCNSSNILHPKSIRKIELRQFLQPMAVILREKAFCLIKDRKYLPACCAHMLYCVLTRQPYNLAYFFAKRIMHVKDSDDNLMPYGMLLTRLYNHFISSYPYLQGPQYCLFNRVMEPITESRISFSLNPERLAIDDILDEELRLYRERRIRGD